MKTALIIGSRAPVSAVTALFHPDVTIETVDSPPTSISGYDMVLDTSFDLDTNRLSLYMQATPKILMLQTLNSGLKSCFFRQNLRAPDNLVVGVNVLTGFAERSVLELCSPFYGAERARSLLASYIKHPLSFTEDRIGLVSARILMMIINEAWLTMQEGTASMDDIDTGMRLGTNYPQGPFAWTQQIGAEEVVRTLDALFDDTHDSRYKVAASLRQAVYKEHIRKAL